MSDRVLLTRDLNRALLARQFLLERSPVPLTRALESLAGLQTQCAPSAYIGLWSRLRDFRRGALTEALEQQGAVQATLMRGTIHTVSAEDFPQWWLRVQQHQVEGLDMEAVGSLLRERLARGPCRANDLKDLLSARGLPSVAWSGAHLWLEMVRVPPSGTWEQRRADLYGLADDWLGAPVATESQGVEHLVRGYLGGFGPAPLNDVANWAGLPVSRVLPAVQGLGLVRYRDERGGDLLDLPDAPLPDPARRHRSASCQRGMRRCWRMRAVHRYFRSGTARWSSIPGPPTRCRRSWSMARSLERGDTSAERCGWSHSNPSRPPRGESCKMKRSL